MAANMAARENNIGRRLAGDATPGARQNYGNKVVGPWVFGMVWKRADGVQEIRMFKRRGDAAAHNSTSHRTWYANRLRFLGRLSQYSCVAGFQLYSLHGES
jgi:hypothetical protein